MRNYKILLIILLSGLMSCSNFLNVTPKNVISMDDMANIKKSLGGLLYNIRENGNGYNGLPRSPFETPIGPLIANTDEWDLAPYGKQEVIPENDYRLMNWENWGTSSLWGKYYSCIGFVNLIIYESGKASGEEDMRDYVMGEAYAMRAYCFFKLVQYFAPYKDNALGIPVCLESYEDFEKVNLARSTQKEVYAQILSDLKEAEKRLERTNPRVSYNLMYSESVINRLYAEVYHFKALSAAGEADDWKNAALYAGRETGGRTLESNPAVLKEIYNFKNSKIVNDPECGLRVWNGASGYSSIVYYLDASQRFYETYFNREDDIRKTLYYQITEVPDGELGTVDKLIIDKFNSQEDTWNYVHLGFRLAEAFLIQAEALAMTDDLNGARELLTRFKQARYTGSFTLPAGKEELLQEIYAERDKEFVSEGDIRWLDMKRLEKSAERTIAGVTYKLEKNDYRYTFPLPENEILNNKQIRQNPGWTLNY